MSNSSKSDGHKEGCVDSSSDANPEFQFTLNEIPVGFQFIPTDAVIIYDYLLKRIDNQILPVVNLFKDVTASEFYKHHPKNIVSNLLEEREWYFFIQQDVKFEDEEAREVAEGIGHWQPYDTKALIKKTKETRVGYKSSFRFFRKNKTKQPKKTHWRMDVYEVPYSAEWTLARVTKGLAYNI